MEFGGLLPKLWSLVANYAVRCELCFEHFIQNDRCYKCPKKQSPSHITTWQSVMEYFDVSLKSTVDKTESDNITGFNNNRDEIASNTFLVSQIAYCPVFMYSVLENCIDTSDQMANFAIMMKDRKEWRYLSVEETGLLFGDIWH